LNETDTINANTRLIRVSGQVQGVGFRPFVYRLALQFHLTGEVKNLSGIVEIQLQGKTEVIDTFSRALIKQAPPLAKPEILDSCQISKPVFLAFNIVKSSSDTVADIHLPPDYFCCDDCLQEISNPEERRFAYPFTNCTQCGPRYTLIKSLPYDRLNTSMAEFPLCSDCQEEYSNPLDRRFHAQPLACEVCGPMLTFITEKKIIKTNAASINACIEAIKQGLTVAIKGIGGYHLVCDALNDLAVKKLRHRKNRPDKPLAAMFPMSGDNGLEKIHKYVSPSVEEQRQITHPMRPIVLVNKRDSSSLSSLIAPGLNEIGVMLPYSPLHHLLLKRLNRPVVATSGNISGEPVLTDNTQAEHRLKNITDAFLHHNRPIQRPADDTVIRFINNQKQTIRLGRGLAPLEITLAQTLKKPVLAVGGHMKSTVALAWKNRCVISPHISDLDSLRGQQVFQQVIKDLQQLYQIQPEIIICDAHPGYFSTRWANQQQQDIHTVLHHHAHAGCIAGDYPHIDKWLCFSWDGTGFGEDGSLWGGEAFYGKPSQWSRVASFRPFFLPGGDQAGRQPWRSEAALRWQINETVETRESWQPKIPHIELSFRAWQKNINCPQSSAVGRLFDAAASMILEKHQVSFEGQGPMMLEAIADTSCTDAIELKLQQQDNLLLADWANLIPVLTNQTIEPSTRAAIFHNSMAQTLINQILTLSGQFDFEAIGLSGGVFQNRLLCEKIMALAKIQGLKIYLPKSVPVNDGGLSFGQVIEYMKS